MGAATRTWRIMPFAYLFPVVVVAFTVAGIVMLVLEPHPFLILWFAGLGWFWFNVLRSPYRIAIADDGIMTVTALTRSLRVPVTNIRSVEGYGWNLGYSILWDGGAAWLRVPLDGSFNFLLTLRELNPSIRFDGV